MKVESELSSACRFWQTGRDGGSSLLRGAARVLTGIPHYFEAPFITAHEDRARQDPQARTYAQVLLQELSRSPARASSEWAALLGVGGGDFAGRGLTANPGKDEQIEQRLRDGRIAMPLWGLSLDRAVTNSYGSRFLLEVDGPFPAVPASLHSSFKAEELELIAGGNYEVITLERTDDTTHATLRWVSPCEPLISAP